MDAWVYRLKAAYDAGYYKTESAEVEQVRFPWQDRTCQDCPFWTNSICQLQGGYRSPTAHTCMYFDPWNRAEARAIIHERQWQGFCRWWEWFNDRGITT